ncbi:MAG: UDP-N-acetylmuramoyl-L-alanine--D-glutamate ligase [candidate division WOR-3 bacterium]
MVEITKNNRRVLNKAIVIGFGRVGQFISQFLVHNGITVLGYDDDQTVFQQKRLANIINNPNFKILNKSQLGNKELNADFAIISPGVSARSNIIKYLNENNIPIYDEIDFTQEVINHRCQNNQRQPILIAITGTNGKSTATSLLGRMLSLAGKDIFWGGNLAPGLPYSVALFQNPKNYYVLEVSSFQLRRIEKFHPQIAILLNITADHLDQHASLSEYQNTKFRIFRNQSTNDYTIINADDKTIMSKIHQLANSQKILFSKLVKTNGAYIKDNIICYRNENIVRLDRINLLGSQYYDSILAAVTCAKILKVKNSIIANVLQNFSGIEHRLEFVGEISGVKYINNSMCTNPTAGIATLDAFSQPVILITGGKEKNLDIIPYIRSIIAKAKIAILFGENRHRLASLLKKENYHNYRLANSLKQAVKISHQLALPNDIVLFSPAFASFDLFQNFQERGNAFKEYVYELT